MYYARIVINNQANDGQYSKSFLLKLAKMGAYVTVDLSTTGCGSDEGKKETCDLSNAEDRAFFKGLA